MKKKLEDIHGNVIWLRADMVVAISVHNSEHSKVFVAAVGGHDNFFVVYGTPDMVVSKLGLK
jgi:hypothetical protein